MWIGTDLEMSKTVPTGHFHSKSLKGNWEKIWVLDEQTVLASWMRRAINEEDENCEFLFAE